MDLLVRSRSRTVRVGISLAGLALLAGACSSSSKNAGTSATTAGSPGATSGNSSSSPSASTGRATGAPLVLGAVSSDSGGAVTTRSNDVPDTLKDWQNWVNNHGGINGHPVKVTEVDDQSDPAKSATEANTFIAQHVIAILDSSGVSASWAKAADAAHIPVIGLVQSGENDTFRTDPNFFGAGMNDIASVWGQTKVAALTGKTNFGVLYCAEVAACQTAVPVIKVAAGGNGVKVAYSGAISSTAPNYTAQCLAAEQAGVNSMVIDALVVKVADDCAKQGYRPQWVESEGTLDQQLRTDPNYNGVVANVAYAPWQLDNTSALQEFHAAVGNLINTSTVPYNVEGTWVGAQLFEAAAELGVSASDTNPTSEDIYNGLYGLNGTTLGGLSASPEMFVKGQANILKCMYIMGIKDGQWTAPYGSQTFCMPDSFLKQLGLSRDGGEGPAERPAPPPAPVDRPCRCRLRSSP
jgi:branched-chain amino acid transport system substrate-binding protein